MSRTLLLVIFVCAATARFDVIPLSETPTRVAGAGLQRVDLVLHRTTLSLGATCGAAQLLTARTEEALTVAARGNAGWCALACALRCACCYVTVFCLTHFLFALFVGRLARSSCRR